MLSGCRLGGVASVSRIFLSHSSHDSAAAVALRQWLIGQRPGLAGEIFLDIDPDTGIGVGVRWKDALRQASSRCEAVICLVSRHWYESYECKTEYRTAEALGKQILVARVEPVDGDITREWQRCDLFGGGPTTIVHLGGGESVQFRTAGLQQLLAGLVPFGIGAEHFPWPPPNEPDRAPYRGWQSFEAVDAAVLFGRDAQIVRGRDRLVAMRASGVQSVFAVLGPSGAGKSAFLRAGLLPRLARDDRHFVVMDILRPARESLTGTTGFAASIHATRARYGLLEPSLGAIKTALTDQLQRVRGWLREIQQAAEARLLDHPAAGEAVPPTLVLPIDQAEELFTPDAGEQGEQLLNLLKTLLTLDSAVEATSLQLIVIVCMRTDRYEAFQTAPLLAEIETQVFDDLGPMPQALFKDVITGPAARASQAGHRLQVHHDLVDRLLTDCTEGADALPLLALTLSRLYWDYGDTGTLTLDHYTALGGIGHVVRSEVDHALAADPAQRQHQLVLLRSAFVPWLATINPDNDQPLRRIAAWTDLPAETHSLLDRFVNRRLLVKDRRDGATVVEVALESLLRQWDDLADWLREHAEDLKNADSVEHAARAWARNSHDNAWLLDGTRLLAAETLLTKPGYRERLAPARAFVSASRQRHDDRLETELRATRRRARILTSLVAVLVAVAVLAAIGFVVATKASDRANAQARQAVSVRLIQDGEATLQGRQSGSDVHAMQEILAARALSPGAQADTALVDALYARRHLLRIVPTPSRVESVAFSPDGTRVVSGGYDNVLRLWDAATGQPIGAPLTGHTDIIEDVAFSPDGTRIASGSKDGTIRLWDAATGRPIGAPLTGHTGPVDGVAFSPDGTRIVSGGDYTLRLWDVATGRPIGQPLTGHSGEVSRVAFSPDGTRIVSGSHDGTILLWDTATGQPIGAPLTGHTGAVFSVAFNSEGTRIVSGGVDGIRLWNAATGQPVGAPLTVPDTRAAADPAHIVLGARFDPTGQRIVAGYSGNVIRVWNTTTRTVISLPLAGDTDSVTSVAFSPDGSRIVSGSDDHTIRIWDATSIALTGHTGTVTSVAVSPDGTRIASGSGDQTVRLWDTATGHPIGAPLTGHTGGVRSVAFSPDGTRIASGSDDNTIRLWDAATGHPIGAPLTGHTDAVLSVAFSRYGTRIASGSMDGTVRLWDVASGHPIGAPLAGHIDGVSSVAFSSDGTRIASGGVDQTVRLWDVTTGHPIGAPLTGHTDVVWSVAFSPDGTRIASGGGDQTVRLWGAATGRPIGIPLTGHTGTIWSLAFSPDGKRIASGGVDQTVRLWDAVTGRPIGASLTGHVGAVLSVAFSPDSTRIASGGRDGTIEVWPVFNPSTKELCAKLPSNMSRKDWRATVSAAIDYTQQCPALPYAPDDSN
uniref:nSTAND1 domain-containing NTPase n=1 Tax=Nocardia terpenica TaxID=455432 RepID=UPI002FCD22DB